MNQQLEDCMLIQHSILQKEDRLVIVPLMGKDEIVDLKGSADFKESQNAIRNIPLFQEEGTNEEENVKEWLGLLSDYVNQNNGKDIRVTIITDKSTEELNVDASIDTAQYYTRVITSGKNVISIEEKNYEVLSLMNGDSLKSCGSGLRLRMIGMTRSNKLAVKLS